MIEGYASRHDGESVRAWHDSGAWGDECVHDMLERYGRERGSARRWPTASGG